MCLPVASSGATGNANSSPSPASLNQVLGHTPAKEFRVKFDAQSENWCIDLTSMTGVTRVLAIENGIARPVEV